MTIESVISLIIALCRYLEVPPEALAQFFAQHRDNQEYFDLVVELHQAKRGK